MIDAILYYDTLVDIGWSHSSSWNGLHNSQYECSHLLHTCAQSLHAYSPHSLHVIQ